MNVFFFFFAYSLKLGRMREGILREHNIGPNKNGDFRASDRMFYFFLSSVFIST